MREGEGIACERCTPLGLAVEQKDVVWEEKRVYGSKKM